MITRAVIALAVGGMLLVYLAGPALPDWLIAAVIAFVAGIAAGERIARQPKGS